MAVVYVNPVDNRDKRYRELNANFKTLAEASGGTASVSSEDITDAGDFGKALIKLADLQAFLTATGTVVSTDSRLSVGAAGVATVRALGTAATNAAAGNHSHTGANILLTGYAIAGSGSAVAATDSTNAAIAKLEKRIADLEAAAVTP